MIIKVVLIAAVLIACWWLLRGEQRGSRLALTRLSGLLFTACWIVAVLAPDLVARLANAMGVGLGSNLVLYALVVAFLFSTLLTRRRTRDLEEQLGTLARAQALLEMELHLREQTGDEQSTR